MAELTHHFSLLILPFGPVRNKFLHTCHTLRNFHFGMEMHKAEMKQSIKSRKRKVREGLVIFFSSLESSLFSAHWNTVYITGAIGFELFLFKMALNLICWKNDIVCQFKQDWVGLRFWERVCCLGHIRAYLVSACYNWSWCQFWK